MIAGARGGALPPNMTRHKLLKGKAENVTDSVLFEELQK